MDMERRKMDTKRDRGGKIVMDEAEEYLKKSLTDEIAANMEYVELGIAFEAVRLAREKIFAELEKLNLLSPSTFPYERVRTDYLSMKSSQANQKTKEAKE